MPLEALLIPVNPTNSDYDGINGGTGCNFIFFNQRVVVVVVCLLNCLLRQSLSLATGLPLRMLMLDLVSLL